MGDFTLWLSSFRQSIADYQYYTDFDKVYKNINSIKVELNILKMELVGTMLAVICKKPLMLWSTFTISLIWNKTLSPKYLYSFLLGIQIRLVTDYQTIDSFISTRDSMTPCHSISGFSFSK